MRYAVIDANGIVFNIIILNDVSQWVGTEQVVQIAEGEWVDIGCAYDENAIPRFSPPVE
jgi:hypothetical protein